MKNSCVKNIILALDFPSFETAKKFIDMFDSKIEIFKIGLEAYLNYGNQIIPYLQSKHKKIFLDLKFNDIENTTIQACKYAIENKFFIFTLHFSNGMKTLKHLGKLIANYQHKFHCAVVIFLTNFDHLDLEQTFNRKEKINEAMLDCIDNFIIKNNLKAVICSAQEAKIIKAKYPHLTTICPGIRLKQSSQDQKRTLTPGQAFANGADYIVIGREITASLNPMQSYNEILEDINEYTIKKL